MPSFEGSVEQQDSKGWTPIMWSSSNGYTQLVKQLIQRGADVNHMGQAKSGSGTTMALHECVAMRGEGGQPQDAFFESAWLLMSAGASPFAERSDGMTPVEVAASAGNMKMKAFLETCSLFRGTMALPVPQTFGSKVKNRYCTVQPRFPFGNAAPTLWLVCYKNPNEPQSSCRIPLSNARVMVEGPQDSSNGIIIIPGNLKSLKGVAIKSHTSNSFIIEIKAIGSPTMPGWKTLRTLADVCKAAAVALSCRNLDQLCAAALRQATRQMRVPGATREPEPLNPVNISTLNLPPLRTGQGGTPPNGLPTIKDAKNEITGPQKAGPMTDTAEDMTLPPAPSIHSMASGVLDSVTEPETPTSSRAADAPRRSSSMGLGKLFKSPFRRSSVANKSRYPSSVLDSNSSLGQFSTAGAPTESPRKSGLWRGIKKSMSSKPSLSSMPSITEQSGGGLTAADIDALSQPIPDKFWSKIGRKMSSQRSGRPQLPPTPGRAQNNWFHNDEGTLAPQIATSASRPRRSFTHDDMDELMNPGKAPSQQAPRAPSSAVNIRRQTADNIHSRASANGTVAFVLEEPIVPTQEMVPTGPRRSFSFDDIDELTAGPHRGAIRSHSKGFADQMAQSPGPVAREQASLPYSQSMPAGRQPQEIPLSLSQQGIPPYGQRQVLQRVPAPRSIQAPLQPAPAVRAPPVSMPRRSFSLHDMDDLLKPAPTAPEQPSSVQEHLQVWRQKQGPQQAALAAKKRGPAIDPFSHGGYVGEHAPEWKPYRPPSAQQAAQARQAIDPRLSMTRSMGRPPSMHNQAVQRPPVPQGQTPSREQLAAQQQGVKMSRTRSTEEMMIPAELAHLASLRALETENLSTTSARADDKGSSDHNTQSQDLGSDLYSSAHGPDGQGTPSAAQNRAVLNRGEPPPLPATIPTTIQAPVSPEPLQKPSVVRVSPAVPAVLFQGAKLPKILTPPQRVSRGSGEIPVFPVSPDSLA